MILPILVLMLALNVDAAYPYYENDTSDYTYAQWYGAPFTYFDLTKNTGTGELKGKGDNGWPFGWLFLKMDMAMRFVAPEDGRIKIAADFSLYFKLIVDAPTGSKAVIAVRYVLLDSGYAELEYHTVYTKMLTSTGSYKTYRAVVSKETSYWSHFSYSLEEDHAYYATVQLYINLYLEGNCYGYSGTAYPFELDVDEIRADDW